MPHLGTEGLQELSKKADLQSGVHSGVREPSLNHCYDLNGIVVHHGTGMHYGHYWSLSRSKGGPGNTGNPKWIEFDDTKTRVVED